MADFEVKLKGWMALPVLVLFVGFAGYRLFSIKTTLASEAAEELKVWIRADYARSYLECIDVNKLDKQTLDPHIEAMAALEKVQIVVISFRGTDPVYVKAEIRVDGKEPPDGRPIRYFLMEYSTLTGWRVLREISALRYHLKLL